MRLPKTLLLLAGLMLAILFLTLSASAQTGPPTYGNWVIEDDTTIKNQDIDLFGSLHVENGGNLTIDNSTITMHGVLPSSLHAIYIADGGKMTATTVTFKPNLPSLTYDFRIEGETFIDNSDISGVTSNGIYYDEDTKSTIMNSIIHDNGVMGNGIFLTDNADVRIINNVIAGMYMGIVTGYSPRGVIDGNEITDATWYGIQLVDSPEFYIANNSISGCSQGAVVVSTSDVLNVIANNDFYGNYYGIQTENGSRATSKMSPSGFPVK